jgi:murein peptide amidase A
LANRRVLRRAASRAALFLAVPAALAAAAQDRTIEAGESVRGHAIVAKRQGSEDAPTKVLAVGQIHGDEPGGLRVIKMLRDMRPPRGVALWTVRSVNPDGARLRIRQNAHGVDLNRNFPRGWRPSQRGSRYYGGRRPLSQPESRAAARLIRRLRPRVTIWFHQPYGFVVKTPDADRRVWRRYARLAGMPTARLPRYPGTATRWQNHRFPRSDAFVVELPGGRLSAAMARRHARVVLKLARWVAHEP